MVEIWTDGSCLGNPGPGGWAYYIKMGEYCFKGSGSEKYTTNNRMEMTAVIKALRRITKLEVDEVTVFTDSNYIVGNLQYLESWKKRGWKKTDKKSILNRDLWEIIDCFLGKLTIHFTWIPAHTGIPENELVDEMARKKAKNQD